MYTVGVDWSTDPPSVASLVTRGMAFAGRYVGLGSAAKQLTATEARALSRAGLRVVSLAEADGRGALGGWSRGATHARLASLSAGRVGAPPSAPIYFAVDFAPTVAQHLAVRDYFRGVASVIGLPRTGAYGGHDVIADLFDHGLIAYGFQTYAWSGGRWDERAQLRQIHNNVPLDGGTVDLCVATVADYGGWRIDDEDQDQGETTMDEELRRAIHHIGWRQYGAIIGADPIHVPAAPELGIEAYELPNTSLRELRALGQGLPGAILTELDRRLITAAAGDQAEAVLPDHLLPDDHPIFQPPRTAGSPHP